MITRVLSARTSWGLGGELLRGGGVGAFGKDLPRAAHAPGSVDLKVKFHVSCEEEERK